MAKGRKNLIVTRTFAKIYGLAGLRLGYAFGHPDVIAYLDRARTVDAGTPSMRAISAA